MKDLGNKPVMAANIKRYMKEKDINAKELSKAIEVPYTTVLSWLKAGYYPRIDKIEKMSEYFGCLKSDLIESKKQPAASNEDDELEENKKALMQLVRDCPEDSAGRLLQIMQLFLESEKQGK